jgi:hypothetical protein
LAKTLNFRRLFRRFDVIRTAACAVAALLCVRIAAGEPTADTYRLGWTRGDGASECPSEAELARAVEARLHRQPFSDAAVRTIEGNVTHAGDVWRAELRVRDGNGIVVGSRNLETTGTDCAALAAAATLAVVLTIDPNAPLAEEAAATPSVAAAAPSAPPVSSATPPASASAATPSSAPPALPPPPCPACRKPVPRIGVSLSAVSAFGLLPKTAFGAELDGHFGFRHAELSVGLRLLPGADTADGHLGFSLGTGSAAGCALGLVGGARLSLCAGAEAGFITAVARDLTPVDPGNYPWVALDAGPRLLWPSTGFGVELGVSGVVPLLRQQFHVQLPQGSGFQTNALGGIVTLGVRAGPS